MSLCKPLGGLPRIENGGLHFFTRYNIYWEETPRTNLERRALRALTQRSQRGHLVQTMRTRCSKFSTCFIGYKRPLVQREPTSQGTHLETRTKPYNKECQVITRNAKRQRIPINVIDSIVSLNSLANVNTIVRVVFCEEATASITATGSASFEPPCWILLWYVLCVCQWTGKCYKVS